MSWSPESWRKKPVRHVPADYPDPAALAAVEEELHSYPPLVFAGEVRTLKTQLAAVGRELVLDCPQSQGASGGPVLNAAGEAVALVSRTSATEVAAPLLPPRLADACR